MENKGSQECETCPLDDQENQKALFDEFPLIHTDGRMAQPSERQQKQPSEKQINEELDQEIRSARDIIDLI